MEPIFYESKPFLLSAIGFIGIGQSSSTSPAAALFGVILIACSALILYLRINYRRSKN